MKHYELPLVPSLVRWTPQALDCATHAVCDTCSIFKHYRLSEATGCQMRRIVAKLKEKGKPEVLKPPPSHVILSGFTFHRGVRRRVTKKLFDMTDNEALEVLKVKYTEKDTAFLYRLSPLATSRKLSFDDLCLNGNEMKLLATITKGSLTIERTL